MSEKEFQTRIVEAAKLYGWMVYHTFDSRRSDPGFPDLVLVQNRVCLFIELKSEKGRVQPEQQEWRDALDQVRKVEANICWPKDEDNIIKGLKRRGK